MYVTCRQKRFGFEPLSGPLASTLCMKEDKINTTIIQRLKLPGCLFIVLKRPKKFLIPRRLLADKQDKMIDLFQQL